MIRIAVLSIVVLLGFFEVGKAQEVGPQSILPGVKFNFGPTLRQGDPWYVPRTMLDRAMSGAYKDRMHIFSPEVDLEKFGWKPVMPKNGELRPVMENWREVMGIIQAGPRSRQGMQLSMQEREILDSYFGGKEDYYYRCIIVCTDHGCFLICG